MGASALDEPSNRNLVETIRKLFSRRLKGVRVGPEKKRSAGTAAVGAVGFGKKSVWHCQKR